MTCSLCVIPHPHVAAGTQPKRPAGCPSCSANSLICGQMLDLRAAAHRLTLKSLDSMPLHNPLTQPLALLVVKLLSATNLPKADWLTQTDCFVRCCALSPTEAASGHDCDVCA